MKKSLIALIVALLFIAFGFAILMICIINNGGSFLSQRSYKLVNTQNISLENIQDIDIAYYSDDIILCAGDTKDIVIKEYKNYDTRDDEKTDISTDDSKISIQGAKWGNLWHWMCNYAGQVEIYLPPEYKGNLTVSTASGCIDSDKSLNLAQLNLSCSSGDIDMKEITSEKSIITTSSGDIDINEITSKEISLTASSGDITVKKAEGELSATAHSGDISIYSLNSKGDIRTSSGDIEVNMVDPVHDLKVEASSGDVDLRLPNTSGFNFTADTSSGDIDTYFNENLSFKKDDHHAEGTIGENPKANIQIDVGSGDITVNQ